MDNQQIITELKRQALELENKAKKIHEVISVLSELEPTKTATEKTIVAMGVDANNIQVDDEIPTDAAGRVAAIIRSSGRFLHKSEIEEIIERTEEAEKFKYLSAILSNAAKNEKHGIAKYGVGTSKNNTFWGFKEWMDRSGNIKSQYSYNEDAVQFKAK